MCACAYVEGNKLEEVGGKNEQALLEGAQFLVTTDLTSRRGKEDLGLAAREALLSVNTPKHLRMPLPQTTQMCWYSGTLHSEAVLQALSVYVDF